MRSLKVALIGVAAALVPLAARADVLTPADIFSHATPFAKLIMAALILSTLAASAICLRKLMERGSLNGGSAFLAGLRFGGPIGGALGAAYSGLNMMVGIANVPVTPSLKVLAPGFAEVIALLGLGFLAGAVAAVCYWAVEARIDRAVLRP